MHELEPTSYCGIEEYRRFIEHRLQAGDIAIGGLYLVLADIRVERAEKEALKFPIRVDTKHNDQSHARLAVYSLNMDLEPVNKLHFIMTDGIAKKPMIMDPSTGQSVQEMYIKDYEDFGPTGPGEAVIEDEIYSTELAIA